MTTRATNLALLILGLVVAGSLAAASPESATLRFLEQRVQSDPLDSVAQNRFAAGCIQQMRETGDLAWLDRAKDAARASLAAVPAAQNPGGLAVHAVVEFEFHHFREALALVQEAYAIDPRNTGALATAGDAQLELGEYAEAEKIYNRIAAEESTPPIRARLARLAELKGDHPRAIQLLQENLSQPGDTAWHRVRLGEIYFRTGDFAKAEEQYEAAHALKPESFLVLEHLAELRGAQCNFTNAIALYQRVIALAPRAEFLQALGDLYSFMNKPAEAKPWHDRALAAYLKSVEQGNAHYYHHLAAFYCDSRENPAEALHWARMDLEVRHSVFAHESLAWALFKNGEFTQAAEEMKRALTLGTKDSHLFLHAVMIHMETGPVGSGGALLKQAMAVNPRYNTFHVHR